MTRYPRDVPDDEHVAAIMRETGFDEDYARFYLAMERGVVDGDVVEVSDEEARRMRAEHERRAVTA